MHEEGDYERHDRKFVAQAHEEPEVWCEVGEEREEVVKHSLDTSNG